ncbi:c6 transcription factor [Ophiostoma piceae UAMH 11346]|uniref:C6 transcription factor n=1 Tax=Ophiostoma piceae (strain UAMH 11346) TaxID=1262450 RepID=S3BQG2_OPHP1|nr:c6 transcription factor [Ophiostoma piceae UAMH 11346]
MARIKKPPTPGRKGKAPPEPKPRACHECKRQKIFCSKHLPKCERCQAKNLDCSYAGPKKIRVNEDKLRYLKAKLERYEEIFKSLPQNVIDSLPDGLSPLTARPGDKEDDDDDDNDLEIEVENDSELDDTEESLPGQFKQMSLYLKAGRGSADNFFQIASRMSGLRDDTADSSHDTVAEQMPMFYDPSMLPRKPATGRDIIELPPVDVARHYFFSQHMYIGTIFAFSDPDTFEKQLDHAYEHSPPDLGDAQSCLTYAKVLMILALGRLYSVNRQTSEKTSERLEEDHPPGFVYFSNALALLPDVHEPGSILGVQTFAYVGYFLQNMNRRDAAFLYIGIALRMAIGLGMHQELPATSSASDTEREHRRRVWWSIYSLDRILSLKSGHPISILDEDIGVRMPSQLPGEAVESPVVVLCCYTELSRILGEINTLIYRRSAASTHTGQSLVQTVHSILQSLIQWEEALPKALRLDPDRGKLSRESISMYLHYYQCINMTARPLLFHVVQRRISCIRKRPEAKEKDWQAGLSAKTVAVIRACMSAARNTVQFMTKAANHNMVATYGYMDGEHVFSAAIVLSLVYKAFPTDAATVDAMGKGLALLRRMGDLGNSYVASRYEQLARLQTILGPSQAESHAPADISLHYQPPPAPPAPPVPPPSLPQQDQQPQQPQEQEQQQGQQHVNYTANADHQPYNFMHDLDLDIELADIDSSGILFMNAPGEQAEQHHFAPQAGLPLAPQVTLPQQQSIHTPSDGVDLDETTMWTTAFTNPAVNFDISQLIGGENDMNDFFASQL